MDESPSIPPIGFGKMPMKGMMNILMVLPELSPFATMSDTGDVGAGLPKALKEMGHDIRIISPQYRAINERRYVLRDVIRLQDIEVSLGEDTVKVNVKSAFLPNSKVQVYFIDYRPFFFREGLYADPKTGKMYSDNDRRFILFAKAVLETLKKLQWQPDIIHCHDWQSGLIPFLLKSAYAEDVFFQKIHSLFTIHDFSVQGEFYSGCVDLLGVEDPFEFKGSDIELNGKCNFTKAGVHFADFVNTVSPAYADEVRTKPTLTNGLQAALKSRGSHFLGVMNGIDNSEWNPETDPLIPNVYSSKELDAKELNKKALLEKCGLPYREDTPVIAMTTPLQEDKGLDLVQDAFGDIMKLGVYFILQGQGDHRLQAFFEKARKRYAKQVGLHFERDAAFMHLIIAGADMLLMPSRVEPCGLTHLYAMSYGTVPVVRSTGGLCDTVQPVDGKSKSKGTGFFFKSMDQRQLVKILKQAVQAFHQRDRWVQIMRNGMRKDFSWHSSAKKYVQLYHRSLSKRG